MPKRKKGREASDLKIIEAMAKSAHEAWMMAQRQEGTTSRLAAWGEEFMVPFEKLSERGKEFDRVIMCAILTAFDGCGFKVVSKR